MKTGLLLIRAESSVPTLWRLKQKHPPEVDIPEALNADFGFRNDQNPPRFRLITLL